MLASKLQTKSTVDESKRDESTTKPHVNVPDNGTPLMLAEGNMLQKSTSSYKPDHGEQKKSDYGVCRVKLRNVNDLQLQDFEIRLACSVVIPR